MFSMTTARMISPIASFDTVDSFVTVQHSKSFLLILFFTP